MASGVNVKMGVSGLSQFKNNMNQAKQATKTLDAQLALTEKQFKASGDAESYLSEKAELLKAKLEQQKTVVSNAEKALREMSEKGVDKGSKSYQDMYRQMINAKGAMIDTQTQIDNIGVASETAAEEVSDMSSQLASINTQVSFETVTKGIDGITAGMEKAAKRAYELGKAIVHGSMDAAAYADDILTRADQYGDDYDAETVQKMDNVSAYIDTSTDTIINAQKRLRKAMGAESNNSVFDALGIDPNSDWEDVFWKAGEALKNLQDDVARENYATTLFGRGWDDLNPLFNAGRQKYEEMLSEQTVLTNAQVEALGKEDDAMKKMQQQIDLLKNQFWAGLAPAITDATNALSGLVEQFNIYLQSDEGQEMLARMGEAVSGLFEDLSKIDPQEVISGFSGVFQSITDGFRWIYDNKQGIINTLEGIVIGWGALKLTGGALKLFELVSGIKGLTLSSAASAGASVGSSWGSAFAAAVLKAAPWLVGLGIISHISPSADNDLDLLWDESGNPTTAAKEAGITQTESEYAETHSAVAPSEYDVTMHGRFTDKQYQLVQDYWDKYRTATATNSDWQAITTEFGKSDAYWNMFLELAAEIQKFDRTVEDLPDYLFNDPTTGKNTNQEIAGAITGLNVMPKEIARAVVASMGGVRVYMDSVSVGHLVAPTVSEDLGAMYTGRG